MSEKSKLPHLEAYGNGWKLIVDGKPFIILAGEVHNSSASSLEYLESNVWDQVYALNCNSVIVPIYWELMEPEEGVFDFSLVDGVIKGARKRNLKLILLWFGTWKNANSTYAPSWVKTDIERFPRAEVIPGQKSRAISCFSSQALQADTNAFAALMKRIKQIDKKDQTVIMVQVENEVGILGGARDRSSIAEKKFNSEVSRELISIIRENKDRLQPEIKNAWKEAGAATDGNWQDVFGANADEIFMSWYIARYVDRVTAAGKKEYDLPVFVNAWLVQFDSQLPGSYPSGGPVSKMIDIWRAAAPNISLLAPDIYLDDFPKVCADYTRAGNPLLIPEARRDETAAANVYYAIGHHHALGFAPFGIESMLNTNEVLIEGNPVADASHNIVDSEKGRKLADAYLILKNMMPLLTDCYGTENLTGFLNTGNNKAKTNVAIGGYNLDVDFHERLINGKTPAAGLILAVDEGEYFIAGHGFTMNPVSKTNSNEYVDILYLEDGAFDNGKWQPGRRLNGDELCCFFGEDSMVRHLKLYAYK